MSKKNYSDYKYVKTKSKDITWEEQAKKESMLIYDYNAQKLLVDNNGETNTEYLQFGSFSRSTPNVQHINNLGILGQIKMSDIKSKVGENNYLLKQIEYKKEAIRQLQEEVKSLEALLSSKEGEVKKHSKRSGKSSIFKE